LHEKDALMVLDTCGQHTIQDRVDLSLTPPVLQTSVATLFQDPVFNLEASTLNWPDAARAVSGQPGGAVANGSLVLRVPDAQRSFTSVRADTASGAGYNQSMLNSPLAWSPATNSAGEWVQLDLGRDYVVRAIVTQGRQTLDEWVTTYRALVSRDGTNFTAVGDVAGSDDRATWRTRRITEVTARYVRVIPLTWQNAIALRVDVDAYQTVEAMRTYSSIYPTIRYPTVRTVRITNGAQHFLHLQEVAIFDDEDVNVAPAGTPTLSSTFTGFTWTPDAAKLTDGSVHSTEFTSAWFLPVCTPACSCASSTCTTAPDSCFLEYCNAHTDLQAVYCSGGTCTSTHTAGCKSHWTSYYGPSGSALPSRHHQAGETALQSCANLHLIDAQPSEPCFLAYCNAMSDLKATYCAGATCTTTPHANACKSHWQSFYGPSGSAGGRFHQAGEYALELCLGFNGSQPFTFAMTESSYIDTTKSATITLSVDTRVKRIELTGIPVASPQSTTGLRGFPHGRAT
jgi:hypothetical protein